MFGKKKEITQKFIEKDEEKSEEITETKKEKNKNPPPNSENNFIFYGSNNKFANHLEIYATLKSNKEQSEILNPKNKKLILVVVDSTSPMDLLSYKIRDSFSQFPEYQNLEGLTATNLTKMDEEKKNLPTEGKVGDFLGNGDIIYLDLISNEIWIKVTITMSNVINKNLQLNVNMDIKVKNELTFRELRYKLLKCGIMCFSDKFSKSDTKYHYIISEFSIFTPAHGNIEENKLKNIDDMKIKQLFTFKNNMKIGLKFYPLEFVLFQKLKTMSSKKDEKKRRLERFKFLKFKELLSIKRYHREKEYIFDYIKKLLKNKTILSKCYVYSLEDDLNADIIDDTLEDKKEEDKDFSISNVNNCIDDADNFDSDNSRRRVKSINQHNNMLNKSTLNKSVKASVDRVSTSIFEDVKEHKCNLILIPQRDEDDDEQKKNIFRNSLNNNFKSSKILNYEEDNYDINFGENIIKSDDNDFFFYKKKRKNSLLNKMSPSVEPIGLEIMEKDKDNLLEKDDEIIIYKELKPKELIKKPKMHGKSLARMSNKSSINLCDDFEEYLKKIKFTNFICGLYLMNIEKGALGKIALPHLRGFKVTEKKIMFNNKKKKKKKIKDSVSYYNLIFPLKRFNCEVGIFSIFIFGILLFLSYLITNTYY